PVSGNAGTDHGRATAAGTLYRIQVVGVISVPRFLTDLGSLMSSGRFAAVPRTAPELLGAIMKWLFTAWRRLKQQGILGMNHRNAACILDHNPRRLFPVVDDKLRMHGLCRQIGVPTPAIYGEIGSHSRLRRVREFLGGHDDFVIKPNRGSAGR